MTDVDADLRAVASAAHVLARYLLRAAEADVGLEPLARSELEILQHVGTHPGATVSEVARALRLQTSNASTALRSLVARGLLERRPDPHDQRRVRLWITGLAERHRDQLADVWVAVLRRALDELGERDAADLRAAAPALERLAAAVTVDALR